jgi:type IV secretory pathway VirB10-like protein
MNNQLLIGIILIVVGIALALMAYAFILNRRDQEKEPKVEAEAEPVPEEEAPPEQGTPPPWIKPPAAAVAAPPAEPLPPVIPAPVPPPVSERPPTPQVPGPAAPPSPGALAPSRRTLAVATLLRDEVTGKLLVLVGDREYATAEELRASKDYARIEYASADLVQWLGVETARGRAADRSSKEEARKPKSMVAQINEILQRKLVEASGTTRGIRLVEGPGGELRVYIGLQSFSLADVPDADVKRMIREAVAEWEAR